MYKLLVVADKISEREHLCEMLQKQVGNLCEIYDVEDEKEAMKLLNNHWGIEESEENDCEQLMKETEVEDKRLLKVQKQMDKYIRKHYEEEISAKDAAEQMNYSEAYFCKLFKQCFGMNFTSYLAKYRIKKAKKLLLISNLSAKEVGKSCGYPDPCYFNRVFKRETGCTPAEYRKQYMNTIG